MRNFFTIKWIRIIFFTLLCLSYQWLFSQVIQNEVIASAGETYILDVHEISWTLGESFIESFQNDQLLISQGFHQPTFQFSEIQEQTNPGFSLNIYPNPVKRFVCIDLVQPENDEHFRLTICDITGKILLNQDFGSGQGNKIDLGQFSEGILFLTVHRLKDGTEQSLKLIRID
jgi:hypothetical protein